jgi:hypothetical protein
MKENTHPKIKEGGLNETKTLWPGQGRNYIKIFVKYEILLFI